MNPCLAIPDQSGIPASFGAVSRAGRQFLQETYTPRPHQPVHLFEAVRAAVVGIGNVLRRFVQKKPQPGASCPAFAFESGEIVAVHGDNGVKAVEILRMHLPCPLGGDVDVVPRRNLDGSRVRRVAYVPGTGSRGIDLEPLAQACFSHDVPKDTFCKRRPADVAKANEEDGVGQAGYPSNRGQVDAGSPPSG